jgi:3-dehydroquinate synthase
MPSYRVDTAARAYDAVIERGVLRRLTEYLPSSAGMIFIVTTRDVWDLHGPRVVEALAERPHEVLYFPGGEDRKRLAEVETLADRMLALGADRTSIVVAFGGGIVTDMAGFLASAFMRGVPVVQVPTTLLAQVDAAVGGKTGVNLAGGKNLFGAFHQPLVVLIDPEVLSTLPDREYRAGLYEIIKCGVIRDAGLFRLFEQQSREVLAHTPQILDRAISDAVRIKAEVVSADEREGGLRRILNFGHTVGHALEAETAYSRFLHGEAVAFGMKAATELAVLTGNLGKPDAGIIVDTIARYGPIPKLDGIVPESLAVRLRSDKKTIHGKVHFVLPVKIGEVTVVSGIDDSTVLKAIEFALQ